MNISETKDLTKTQYEQINRLWNEEFPVSLKDRFTILLEGVEVYNHYLIEEESNVWAWAVHFYKDKETRFSLIVNKDQQGKGFGSYLIKQLQIDLKEFCGYVIDHNNEIKQDGKNYKSPLPFYLKHGFIVLSDNQIDNNFIRAIKIKWQIKD